MKRYAFIVFITCLTACSKNDFLDARPDQSLVVPTTIADYQAILDNDLTMNGEAGTGLTPALGETGSDNYYVTPDVYNSFLTPLYKRAYVWDKNVFEQEQVYDWNIPYQSIYRANIVLDGLATLNIDAGEEAAYNKAKGSALFYRAHLFYQLAQIFAKHYSKDSAANLPGIPLRLTSLLTETLRRGTLEQTYEKITADLKMASVLLPSIPEYATQPCKAASYGLLARVYLTMQDYEAALLYADSSLYIEHALMDYNAFNAGGGNPFTVFNEEIIFQCEMIKSPDLVPVNPNYAFADSVLYGSYDDNDLRKILFFAPRGDGYYFIGSYSGYNRMFAGIATDELYLIRAECNARNNKTANALDDINRLLEKRFTTGSFIPFTINNTPDVLQLVLNERRKELCFRGLRWADLRRLNKDGANIGLQRNIDGVIYTLPANDSRYVYPIPSPVIDLNPSIEQNIR